MRNNYEGAHFSKVAGLLLTILLKKNSVTDIFQLFSSIYTIIYFAEQVSLATPESISYRSIKNSYCVSFLVFIIYTCFFLTVAVILLNKFSIKKKSKYRISYFINGLVIYASKCEFKRQMRPKLHPYFYVRFLLIAWRKSVAQSIVAI